MPQNKTVNYKGVDIHYAISGDKSTAKDTFVFLHPAFAGKEVFEFQLDYFAKDYLPNSLFGSDRKNSFFLLSSFDK